jgi:hypothetical protein
MLNYLVSLGEDLKISLVKSLDAVGASVNMLSIGYG